MPVDPEHGVTAAKTDVYPAVRAASPGAYRAARAHLMMPHAPLEHLSDISEHFSDISARLLAAPPGGYPAAKAHEPDFAAAAPRNYYA
jgi:hypothetical protein